MPNDPPALTEPIAVPVDYAKDRCPELALADRKTFAKTIERPWTTETGATRGQMKAHIDAQDVLLVDMANAGKRVAREYQRCRDPNARPPTS